MVKAGAIVDPEIELSRAVAQLWQFENQKLEFLGQMALKRIELEQWYERDLRSLQAQHHTLSAQIDRSKTSIDQQFQQKIAELDRIKAEFEARISKQKQELTRVYGVDLKTLSDLQNNLLKEVEFAFQKIIFKHSITALEVTSLTSILKACQSGNVEQLRTLLPLGSPLKQPLSQCYPLHIAALQGSVPVIEFLLASGFIDSFWQGKSAFDIACLGGHPGVVKHLSEQSILQTEKTEFHPSWAPYRIPVPSQTKGVIEIYRENKLFTSQTFDHQEYVQLFLDEGEYQCQLKINEEHCNTFPIRVKDVSPFVDKTIIKEAGKPLTIKFRGLATGRFSLEYQGVNIETFILDSNQYFIIDTDELFDSISFNIKRKNLNKFSHPIYVLEVFHNRASFDRALPHIPQILSLETYDMPVPPSKGYVEIWQAEEHGNRIRIPFDRSHLPQRFKEVVGENWERTIKQKIPLITPGITHLQVFVDGVAMGRQNTVNVVPASVFQKNFKSIYSVGEEIKVIFRSPKTGRIEFWLAGRQEHIIELSKSKGATLHLKSPGAYQVKTYFQDDSGRETPCTVHAVQVEALSILFDFPDQIGAWETYNCSFRIPFTGRIQLKRNNSDIHHWDLKGAETFSCILTEPGTAEFLFKMTEPFKSEYTVAVRVSPGSCLRQTPPAEIPCFTPYSMNFKSALTGVLEIIENKGTRSLPFNQVKNLTVPFTQRGRVNLALRISHPENQSNYIEAHSLEVQTGNLDFNLPSEIQTWQTYCIELPFSLSGSLKLKKDNKEIWTKSFTEVTKLPFFLTAAGRFDFEFRYKNPETGLEEVMEFSRECEARDVLLEPFPKVFTAWGREYLRFRGPKTGRINVLRGGCLQRDANIFFRNQDSVPLSFCKEGDVQLLVSIEGCDGKTQTVKTISFEVQHQKPIPLPETIHVGELIALPGGLKGSVTLKQNGFQRTSNLEDVTCLKVSTSGQVRLEFTYYNPENTSGIHTLQNPVIFNQNFDFDPKPLMGKACLNGKTLEVSLGNLRGQMIYQDQRLLMCDALMPCDEKAQIYYQISIGRLEALLSVYDKRNQALMLLSSLRMILLQNPYAKFVQPLLENLSETFEELQRDEALFAYYQDVIAWYQVAEITTIDLMDNNLGHALITNMTLSVALNRTSNLKVLSLAMEPPLVVFESLLTQALFLQLVEQKLAQGFPLETLLLDQRQLFQNAEVLAKSNPRASIDRIDSRLNEVDAHSFILMAEVQRVLQLSFDFKLVEDTLETVQQNLEQTRDVLRRDSANILQSQGVQQQDLNDLKQKVEATYQENIDRLRLLAIQQAIDYVAGMHDASRTHSRVHEQMMHGAMTAAQNLANASTNSARTRTRIMGEISSQEALGLALFTRAEIQQNQYIRYLSALAERAREEREARAKREEQMYKMVFGLVLGAALMPMIAPSLIGAMGTFLGKMAAGAISSGVSSAIGGDDNIAEAMVRGAFFSGFSQWMNGSFKNITTLKNFADEYPKLAAAVQTGAIASLSTAVNSGDIGRNLLASMAVSLAVQNVSERLSPLVPNSMGGAFEIMNSAATATLTAALTNNQTLGQNLLAGGIGALQTGGSLLGEHMSAGFGASMTLNQSLGLPSGKSRTTSRYLDRRSPLLARSSTSNRGSITFFLPEGESLSTHSYPPRGHYRSRYPNAAPNSQVRTVQNDFHAQEIKLSDEAFRSLIIQGDHPLDQLSTLPTSMRPHGRSNRTTFSQQQTSLHSSTRSGSSRRQPVQRPSISSMASTFFEFLEEVPAAIANAPTAMLKNGFISPVYAGTLDRTNVYDPSLERKFSRATVLGMFGAPSTSNDASRDTPLIVPYKKSRGQSEWERLTMLSERSNGEVFVIDSHSTFNNFIRPGFSGIIEGAIQFSGDAAQLLVNPRLLIEGLGILTIDIVCSAFQIPLESSISRFEQRIQSAANMANQFENASLPQRVQMISKTATEFYGWSKLLPATKLAVKTSFNGAKAAARGLSAGLQELSIPLTPQYQVALATPGYSVAKPAIPQPMLTMFSKGHNRQGKTPLAYGQSTSIIEKIRPEKWTVKARMKQAQLPNEGRIRFIPPDNYKPTKPLLKGQNGGYIDRFENEWNRGQTRTIGESFEWDVILSEAGKRELGWLSRNGKHINVSLKGHITHK